MGTELSVGRFPLFLEGVVRMMKTLDAEEAVSIYDAVKRSGLRDEDLKMYTLSSSLVGQSYNMGRMAGFSPGWLENQSVWMPCRLGSSDTIRRPRKKNNTQYVSNSSLRSRSFTTHCSH